MPLCRTLSCCEAELKEDITAEESFETKKCKLAELGITLLADPESNIKLLKEMLQMCNDHNHAIVKLGLLSLLAVFKDIIPGYHIRLPTEKELVMKVSKDVKKMRKLCCDTIKSLFTNEGKHSGEVTGAAVRLIANYVKAHNCQMHPDSIQSMSLF
ncbi:nucleolar complex protein 3 homolog [Eucalyptus grandis]|uniref:nucleolar complex protein 3 homolog n=1 Tax=Eucalyptus grandis TaxID=71139 RepID=UPI00192F0083|nr:nucleolar complex protein 3 homolog [Eucalyptus grandis]